MKILVVEDDVEAANLLARGLQDASYAVELAHDGASGLARAIDGKFDALVVDRMLPRLDGLRLVSSLRRTGRDSPVLFLSALGDVDERVRGLRAGGDDYVAKPFAFVEVLARLEALLRRRERGADADPVLRVGDLELHVGQRIARRAGRAIALNGREYQVLEYLMRHAGQVVTRAMLVEAVWHYHFDPRTNVIDVYVSRVRQKLDAEGGASLIRTVRGAGYLLRDDGEP